MHVDLLKQSQSKLNILIIFRIVYVIKAHDKDIDKVGIADHEIHWCKYISDLTFRTSTFMLKVDRFCEIRTKRMHRERFINDMLLLRFHLKIRG